MDWLGLDNVIVIEDEDKRATLVVALADGGNLVYEGRENRFGRCRLRRLERA